MSGFIQRCSTCRTISDNGLCAPWCSDNTDSCPIGCGKLHNLPHDNGCIFYKTKKYLQASEPLKSCKVLQSDEHKKQKSLNVWNGVKSQTRRHEILTSSSGAAASYNE